MPERVEYESHLAIEAVAFVTALPKRKKRLVLDLADQIARQPFQIGDYQTTDSAGRVIEICAWKAISFHTGWITPVERSASVKSCGANCLTDYVDLALFHLSAGVAA